MWCGWWGITVWCVVSITLRLPLECAAILRLCGVEGTLNVEVRGTSRSVTLRTRRHFLNHIQSDHSLRAVSLGQAQSRHLRLARPSAHWERPRQKRRLRSVPNAHRAIIPIAFRVHILSAWSLSHHFNFTIHSCVWWSLSHSVDGGCLLDFFL